MAAVVVAAVKGLSMPTMGSFRPERIDRTIDQLERWLGLRADAAQDSGTG